MTSKPMYDMLWSGEIERVSHFGNLLPYTLSLGLPSVTVLEEEKSGDKHRSTDRPP